MGLSGGGKGAGKAGGGGGGGGPNPRAGGKNPPSGGGGAPAPATPRATALRDRRTFPAHEPRGCDRQRHPAAAAKIHRPVLPRSAARSAISARPAPPA